MVSTPPPEQYTNGALNKDLMQKVAITAYSGPRDVPLFLHSGNKILQLMDATDTLKLWRLNPSATNMGYFIVGIRGTKPSDVRDIKADAAIAVNKLISSARWNSDKITLNKWKNGKYGQGSYGRYIWVGAGHSLGGALLDLAIKTGIIRYAVSYNGAVERVNKASPYHYKIYADEDLLYKVGKIFGQDPAEDVRHIPENKMLSLASYIPSFVGTAAKTALALKAHSIGNFTGGGLPTNHTPNYREMKIDNSDLSDQPIFDKPSNKRMPMKRGQGRLKMRDNEHPKQKKIDRRDDIDNKFFGGKKKGVENNGRTVLCKPEEITASKEMLAPTPKELGRGRKKPKPKDPLKRLRKELEKNAR